MQADMRSTSDDNAAANSCLTYQDCCLLLWKSGVKEADASRTGDIISYTTGVQVLTSADEFASVRDSLRALGIRVAEDRSGLVFSPLTAIEVRSPAIVFGSVCLPRSVCKAAMREA